MVVQGGDPLTEWDPDGRQHAGRVTAGGRGVAGPGARQHIEARVARFGGHVVGHEQVRVAGGGVAGERGDKGLPA